MMCAFMVLGMSIYNVLLIEGLSDTFMRTLVRGYLPAFAVALVLDIFVVGPIAKGLAGRLIKANDPMIKKMLLISSFMVLGMVLLMSFYGAVLHAGFSRDLPLAYVKAAGFNVICALPLQLLVVGPLTRYLFGKLSPARLA